MMGRVARPPYPFLPCVARGRSRSQAIVAFQKYNLILSEYTILPTATSPEANTPQPGYHNSQAFWLLSKYFLLTIELHSSPCKCTNPGGIQMFKSLCLLDVLDVWSPKMKTIIRHFNIWDTVGCFHTDDDSTLVCWDIICNLREVLFPVLWLHSSQQNTVLSCFLVLCNFRFTCVLVL